MSACGQVRAVNGAVGCAPPAEQGASVTYKPGPQSGSSGSSGEGGPGSGDGREGRECLPAWEGGVLGAERNRTCQICPAGAGALGAWPGAPATSCPPTLLPHLLTHFPDSRSWGGGRGAAAPPRNHRVGARDLGTWAGADGGSGPAPHMMRSTCCAWLWPGDHQGAP